MNERGGKKDFLCTRCCLLRNAVLSVQLSGAIAKGSALAFRYVTRGINPKFKRDTAADFTLLTSPCPIPPDYPVVTNSAPLRSLLPLPIPPSLSLSLFLSFSLSSGMACSLSATILSSRRSLARIIPARDSTGETTTRSCVESNSLSTAGDY